MDPKLKAFLDLIAWSEGTHAGLDNGYGVIVSGVDGPNTFTDYTDHPFANGRPGIMVRRPTILYPTGLFSTASGRYQLMLRWWLPYKISLKLKDFSPASQDTVAIQQIRERKAISLIEVGNITAAIQACSNIWASFPGNTYGEGGKNLTALLAQYGSLLPQSQVDGNIVLGSTTQV